MKIEKHIQVVRRELVAVECDWLFYFRDLETGREWEEDPKRNKVVIDGLYNLLDLLVGNVPSDTAAMYLVIGDNASPASQSDTLADMNEVFRTPLVSKTRQGTTARLRAQLLSGDANGTHHCVGVVARGTSTAGSGVLLNRFVQPFNKSSNIVLTIESKWTLTGVS